MNPKQVMQRYLKEFAIAMVAYMLTLIASISILQSGMIQMRAFVIFISLLPALPVAVILVALLRAQKDSDELQQHIQLMATSLSAALTGFITFSYGFLENVGFPKFPTFLVFPMLLAIWGVSLAWFNKRYR